MDICPRCRHRLLFIEGKFVGWLTCPHCKWKKLVRKKNKDIKIVPLMDNS